MNEYKFQKRPFPRVKLHPASIKHIKKGHPWVTEDSFSKAFPKDKAFLIGATSEDNEFCLLLHDPSHKIVKARLWSTKEPFVASIKNFGPDLTYRLIKAFTLRQEVKLEDERDNYYLVFGESDLIPGLNILKLKDTIVIQYYAHYWKTFEHLLLNSLTNALTKVFGEKLKLSTWIQERDQSQTISMRHVFLPSRSNKKAIEEFELEEFGVKYSIKVNQNYDLGIYTDMASVRKDLIPYFKKSKNALNLFSYTGAFSLFALNQGVKQVTSVDLSKKYLKWLEKNLELNPEIKKENHRSINMPTAKALLKLKEEIKEEHKAQSENKYFDFIICDPPSFSSDGKSNSSALKSYEELLPLMEELLTKDGRICVFLNTHSVSHKKFENRILELAKGKLKLERYLKMKEDCLALPTFREGNYIKGLILKR